MSMSIHSPTAPSYEEVGDKATLQDIIASRSVLEAELTALGSVLKANNVTMTTPLVDSEGYPRADIDVAKIRIARARIIRLQNDYKKVMDKLKVAVEDAFASAETASETDTESIVPSSAAAAHGSVPSETTNGHSDADIPFAVVDEVSEGGPAAAAGLKVGDKVTAFGSVDWTKADKFKLIQAEVMKNPPNVAIVVKIMRMDKKEDVMITPKSDWGGRGSLGCHLKPL